MAVLSKQTPADILREVAVDPAFDRSSLVEKSIFGKPQSGGASGEVPPRCVFTEDPLGV